MQPLTRHMAILGLAINSVFVYGVYLGGGITKSQIVGWTVSTAVFVTATVL